MPRRSVLALLCAVPAAACLGDGLPDAENPFRIELAVAPTPPIEGPALLVVTIHDEHGEPVDAAQVRIEGLMTHPGMVPVEAEASPTAEPGRYRVPAFDFSMAGDWVLRIHVSISDGAAVVHERPLRVISALPPERRPSDPR